MATKKQLFPKITKGSHLTITEYKDGTVDMKWDWDKLTEEINQATSNVKKPKLEVIKNKKSKK